MVVLKRFISDSFFGEFSTGVVVAGPKKPAELKISDFVGF